MEVKMEMTTRVTTLRGIFLILLGSIACLLCAFISPVGQAYAGGSCNSKSSASNGTTSEALVCVSRTSILNTLGLDSEDKSESRKVTICHIPPGNKSAEHTITVDQSAVPAHMAHGDSMGPCPGWVNQSYIESLPTCAAIIAAGAPTVDGCWVPSSALGNDTALNAYFEQIQSGVVLGQADSAQHSYREIHGQ
jgi:hypothetical protein